MSELPSRTNEVMTEVEAILKEPGFLTDIKAHLETIKPQWKEAIRRSTPSNRDLAAAIALGEELSRRVPDQAARLEIFEMLTTVNDPHEGALSRIHNVIAFTNEKGEPTNIIDPTFGQYDRSQTFYVGHRNEAFPNYRVPNDTRPIIPVKVDRLTVTEFTQRNKNAINNFRQALQTKS